MDVTYCMQWFMSFKTKVFEIKKIQIGPDFSLYSSFLMIQYITTVYLVNKPNNLSFKTRISCIIKKIGSYLFVYYFIHQVKLQLKLVQALEYIKVISNNVLHYNWINRYSWLLNDKRNYSSYFVKFLYSVLQRFIWLIRSILLVPYLPLL